MRNFRNLLVWQKGMTLAEKIYLASKFFPDDEKFGMRSQMTRTGVSIPTNIAEGSAKRSVKEYVRYLEISLGSCYETQLLIAENRHWFPEEIRKELLELTIELQKMLTKFIEKTT